MSVLFRIVATTFLALVVGLVTTTSAEAAPKYGPYTDPVYGLQARVSPAAAGQAKTFVQVRRITADTTANTGERQVRLQWRIGNGPLRTSTVRTLAKGERTTFATTKAACGQRVRVIIGARGRVSSSQAYTDWQNISSSFVRSC